MQQDYTAKTVTIDGKEYKVRYTIRALFLWEQIADRSFELKTLLDHYLFYFCLIIANNPDAEFMWDDWIDQLDRDPMIVNQIQAIMGYTMQRDEMLNGAEEDTEDGEKKN